MPILLGIALSLAQLFTLENPGVEHTEINDAQALYFGVPLYDDPAEGFSGMIYTPLYPALIALLYFVDYWNGWALLITVLSSLALLGLGAWFAYAPRSLSRGDRAVAVLEALGLGAIAWVLVTVLTRHSSFAALNDQLGWGLSLFGLVALAAGSPRSRRPVVLAILLFTAAAWTRQNTVIVAAASALWLVLEVAARRTSPRRAAGFVLGLGGANLVVLGALNVLWEGWPYFFMVAVPGEHALGDLGSTLAAITEALARDFLGGAFLPLLFTGVLWLAVSWRGADPRGVVRESRRRMAAVSGEGRGIGPLAVLVLAGGIVVAVSSYAVQRTVAPVNFAWALGLLGGAAVLALCAVAWIALGAAALRRRRAGGPAGGAATGLAQLDRRTRLAVALCAVVGAYAGYRFFDQFAKIGDRNFPSIPVPWTATIVAAAAAVALTVGLLFLLVTLVVLDRGRQRAAESPGPYVPTPRTRAASALALFLSIGIVSSVYLRNKLGADDHYYIGMVWALGFLAAIAYRQARERLTTSIVAVTAVLGVVALSLLGPFVNLGIYLPSLLPQGNVEGERTKKLTVNLPEYGLMPTSNWAEDSEPIQRYAARRTIYAPEDGALNLATRGDIYQEYDNWYGMVAAGTQPTYLIDAFIDRRFETVKPYDFGKWDESFATAEGRFEENFFWKLDRVVRTHYGPRSSPPVREEFLARRPGPAPAPWMKDCFAPFELGGATFRIHRGGGFWCQPPDQPDTLTLRETPAPFSDVRTVEPITEASGTLGAVLPEGSGAFEVILEPVEGEPWRVRGEARPGGGVELFAVQKGRVVGRTSTPASGTAAQVELRLGRSPGEGLELGRAQGGLLEVGLPDLGEGAVLRLSASRGSGARFDLGRVQLR